MLAQVSAVRIREEAGHVSHGSSFLITRLTCALVAGCTGLRPRTQCISRPVPAGQLRGPDSPAFSKALPPATEETAVLLRGCCHPGGVRVAPIEPRIRL